MSTLGFRGEALASIASVSEITLISRAKNSDIARKIVLSGGKVLSECDDSRAEGTIITVENLFFNTPARLKFLKKPSTELGYITDTVEKSHLQTQILNSHYLPKTAIFSFRKAAICAIP